MRTWFRDHGLTVVLTALFLLFVVGMTLSGWRVASSDALEHGRPAESLLAYLGSGDFWEAIFENWESEFLQMGAYIVFTVFLFQRGSPESKPVGEPAPQDEDPRDHRADPDAPRPVRRGGAVLVLYENSLLLLFAVLFVGAALAHAAAGVEAYNEEQLEHTAPTVTVWGYLASAQFWFESMQNWQSEFMVMAVLALATVWLRQRGSSQSKPVHAPHASTGG